MSEGWRTQEPTPEFELASRRLLRKLSEVNDRMAAAEPGTDDFIDAYTESRRLKWAYRHVRETWQVPSEIRSLLPQEGI